MSDVNAFKARRTCLGGCWAFLCVMLVCWGIAPDTAKAAINVTNNAVGNSGPHFNNDGSRLAFFSNDEIYVANSDGSGQNRLTSDEFRDYQPHFSRDGQKIVYKSVQGGNSNVWVMNADGSGKTQLTFDTYGEDPASPPSYGADWSPDGSRIVFDSMRSGNHDIWVMNADGSNPVRLTSEPGAQAHPVFSPDGTKIAYWSDQSGERAIYVMDVDGQNKRLVTTPATNHPHFNHDGTRISFGYNSRGHFVNVDGTGRQPIPYDPISGTGDWSRDGSKLAYMASGDIYVYTGDLTPPAAYAYPSGALYAAPVTVTLSSSEPGGIRYTTDGSEPTPASALYEGPFRIGATTALKLVAVDAAGNSSPVRTESYTIDPQADGYVDALSGGYETLQSRNEFADVTIQHGYVIKYIATGALSGYITESPSDLVSITSGTYAGWKFRKAQYEMGSYAGMVYMLYNSAQNKAWGLMTGDIHGVRMDADGISKLYLTSVRGAPKSGTVDLASPGDYYGALEQLPAARLTIVTNSNTVNGSAGAVHNNADRIKIFGVSGAFTTGAYQSAQGNGNLYQYSEDSPTSPGVIRNFGMADGPLMGTRELDVPYPTSVGSPLYVRAEKVLGDRVLPAAPKYITNSIQSLGASTTSPPEMVDVMLEQGAVLTFTTSGAVTGDFEETLSRVVTIQNGSYAGWWYRKGTYQIGSYSGSCYMVSDGKKGWGMLTGDLHAARVWDGESRKIYLTSIKGAQASGVIELSAPRKQAGTQTFVPGMPLFVTENTSSGPTAGLDNGWFQVAAKSVKLGSYPEVFRINSYQGEAGGGTVYLYADFDQEAHPGVYAQYGMGDGPFFGPRQVETDSSGATGTELYVRIEHVLDVTPPVVTATPVAGSYPAPQNVILSANEPATIHYALDGFDTYAVYSGPLAVNGSQHLKYYAVDSAGNTSAVQQAVYAIETSAPAVTINPAAGYYGAAQTVALETAEPAAIYYSLNGQAFVPYSGPFTLESSTTVAYYSLDGLGNTGPVRSAYFSVVVKPYASGVNATFTSFSPSRSENADVTVQKGQVITMKASGFLEGDLVETVTRSVAIKSGSYAGWSYMIAPYRLGSYSGTARLLVNGSRTWGVLDGGINGIVIRNGNVRTLYVTSLNGDSSSGKVDLVHVGTTPPTSVEEYPGMTLNIVQNSQTGTSTGWYEGELELQFNLVRIEQLREGFVTGSYQSSLGSGSVYLYADNQPESYVKRKGILTGGLFATYEGYVPLPVTLGSKNQILLRQFTGSRVRSTSTLIVDPQTSRIIEVDGNQQISVVPVSDPLPLRNPVNAQRVAGDRTLITDTGNNRVVEVDPAGSVLWQYTDLNSPRWAERLFNGNTLIADCQNHRVVEVTTYGKVVWEYGVKGTPGAGVGQLNGPTAAYRLADGTTLIVDCMNHRVLLVKSTDYNPAIAGLGWKSGSVAWQYGTTGLAGSGASQLNTPRRAQPLDSGNILISDTENHRVIEVSRDKRIIWQYGSTGVAGELNSPRSLQRLENGDTIIADNGNGRIIEVGPKRSVLWEYQGVSATSALDVLPRTFVPDTTPPVGSLLINGGAPSTSSPYVYLTSNVYDGSGSVSAMRFSEDNVTWKAWQPFSSNKSWSLTPELGSRTVYAQYKDASGNVMLASATILLTAVAPQVSSVTVGSNVITAPSATSSLSFSDVTSPGTVTVTPVNPVSQPANFQTLSGACYEIATTAVHDGNIEVCLNYNDAALANTYNEGRIRLFHMENGEWTDVTTLVDTLNKKVCGVTTSLSPFALGMPAETASCTITAPSSGATRPAGATLISGETTDPSGSEYHKVEVSTNGGVSWQIATDTSGGSWSAWNYTWTPQLSGAYQVQARATDLTGATETLSEEITIRIDAVAPGVSASPSGGSFTTPVAVTLNATEPCSIYYTLDGSEPTTASTLYQQGVTVSATATLKFFAVDGAGNRSTVQSTYYSMVAASPPAGIVSIALGQEYVTSTSVLLNLSAGSSVTRMRFSNDGTFWGPWATYTETAIWDLPAGEGVKTVYAQFGDAAGAVSPAPYASDTVQLVGTPPVAAAVSRVPVMNGWWLFPGVLSGLLLLRRRRG